MGQVPRAPAGRGLGAIANVAPYKSGADPTHYRGPKVTPLSKC